MHSMVYKITARASIYVEIEGEEDQIEATLERAAEGADGAFDNLIVSALDIEWSPFAAPAEQAVPRFKIHDRAGLVRVPAKNRDA